MFKWNIVIPFVPHEIAHHSPDVCIHFELHWKSFSLLIACIKHHNASRPDFKIHPLKLVILHSEQKKLHSHFHLTVLHHWKSRAFDSVTSCSKYTFSSFIFSAILFCMPFFSWMHFDFKNSSVSIVEKKLKNGMNNGRKKLLQEMGQVSFKHREEEKSIQMFFLESVQRESITLIEVFISFHLMNETLLRIENPVELNRIIVVQKTTSIFRWQHKRGFTYIDNRTLSLRNANSY